MPYSLLSAAQLAAGAPAVLQSAVAIAPATPSITMAVLGVATSILALLLSFAGGLAAAYKLGGVARDVKASDASALASNATLARSVAEGFAAVHKRLDEVQSEQRDTRHGADERRDEWMRWRNGTDKTLGLHGQKIETLEKSDDERRESERRVGPAERRAS